MITTFKNKNNININIINLKDLIKIRQIQNPYSKIRGGMTVTVHFKRNLIENTNYRFVGVCVSSRKKSISSSIIVRNVISLYPLEYTFNIYSPLVTVISKKSKKRIRRAKFYFLRGKPAPMSKINFKYVI